VSCALGDLAVGREAAVSIVTSYKTRGSIDNTVTVSTTAPDIVTTNNTSRLTLKLR